MHLLILNAGSSTLRYELFRADAGELTSTRTELFEIAPGGRDHAAALHEATRGLAGTAIRALGHRIVHGGDAFTRPTRIDDDVLERLERLNPLAPLHNPPAIAVIRAALREFGRDTPNVAFFDTAFHQTLPERARTYAIPRELGYRRYGFHGISHRYVMEQYAERVGRPRPTIITLHLGGGCSACAIREGHSIDTSMGYTPLEGLVMGTRSGDLDPAIAVALTREGKDVDRILNRESGLKALAGTSDLREILRKGDDAALDVFCYRITKYVGAYLAALGGAEAVVFTGGIGENAAEVRRRVCEGFAWAGLVLDEARNAAARPDGRISTDGSRLAAWVIPTDEERWMAKELAQSC
ncbi:MAG: acetate/propionate family kinase [Planctomycetes bacterium]|nr:acetate/propionate family kinase [Planctomycetota bacterium]